ncbi:hypothetical protein [Rhabdaerophilum calidifontis]|uniref:hypothetical protein n=1 Tax=Rhabdaerophilum calidifontis TaxID=2604328 RepID=UPI00123AA5D7|nr:hypothetical protein [Rhabdaerophilum calidifontis]
MAIDPRQDRRAHPGADEAEEAVCRARLVARGAGVLAAAAALLQPFFTHAAESAALAAPAAGLLVWNLLGLVLHVRFGPRGAPAMLAAAGFAPLIAAAAAPWPVTAAIGLVALSDAAISAEARPGPRALLLGLAALAVALTAAILVPAALPVLFAALLPVPVEALLRRHLGRADPTALGAEILRLRALLAAQARGSGRRVVVTDIVGMIDPVLSAAERDAAEAASRGAAEAESLVAATLIADRPMLLEALSRAVHGGVASRDLALRMLEAPAGAGYPAPPRFSVRRLGVEPLPGLAGRAIVVIERDGEAPAADAAPGPVATLDPVPLRRALHDCVAPFNAGLGFLDMIADPQLAPRDIATYRDFAAEAHRAIAEAHRNAVLLGRLLDLARHPRAARETITPGRLVGDAIRALHLRRAVEIGQIRLGSAEALPPAALEPATARLAVEALMRHAAGAARAEIVFAREGEDLVLTCYRDEGADPAAPDGLQAEIEAAAAAGGALVFEDGEADARRLRLRGAYAAECRADAPAVRLAS